jgi:hypothetical protein
MSDTLLSQTLPTVVGMGIVARTTETILSKRRSRRRAKMATMSDPRYKMPAETRKFGGKVYKYLVVGTKTECEKDAERWRGLGYSVRVVPFGRKYAVYARKGR